MEDMFIVVGKPDIPIKWPEKESRYAAPEIGFTIYKSIDITDASGSTTRIETVGIPDALPLHTQTDAMFYVYKSKQVGRSFILAAKEGQGVYVNKNTIEDIAVYYDKFVSKSNMLIFWQLFFSASAFVPYFSSKGGPDWFLWVGLFLAFVSTPLSLRSRSKLASVSKFLRSEKLTQFFIEHGIVEKKANISTL
ncbi:hypothetical protein [Vibrio intestinalis]|uniref:hypothetical protein n=1 Tax=Vibrio intestinalis TaxID=2933291 RepID=UPI0021A2D5AA|nr:hypothetical protein [Vibrio intestinalis]